MNIYFIDPENPSKIVKSIAVAGHTQTYTKLNELEYYKGYLYANIWHESYIIKINPLTGEVIGKFDFSDIVKENSRDTDKEDALNGIAFKGDDMLITGKRWSKIYELKIEN